jgi:sterol desaturase/sphingolipid hydroxylase (fatty acid hydroxylase superfamily)
MTWEPWIRLGSFAGVLLLMAVAERFLPRRAHHHSKPLRWVNNLGLVVFNTLVIRVVVPTTAVAVAVLAQERGWGVFNNLDLPAWAAVLVSIIALDLVIYLQHVLFHAAPILWRLHKVHHADLDFDASTGLRFHTLEILLSLGLKLAAVCLLGPPALAVLLFEVLLNASALFNHGNLKLPLWLDRGLRVVLVTPDMHRVHHSTRPVEANSNFGFCLPWWDWLFGTYRAQPMDGHEGMTIGLAELREPRVEWLPWMLALPAMGPRSSSGLFGEPATPLRDAATNAPPTRSAANT